MRSHRLILAIVFALGFVRAGQDVQAQSDPRQVLAGMIFQVSTGTPNPAWYGQQLWQTIAFQTGNTGVYPQLRQLGSVQNVVITQWVVLPGGIVYAMTAQHASGVSYWYMGIGTYTNRIEYASFAIGATPYALPGASSGPEAGSLPPSIPTIGTPPAQPAPKPAPTGDQSEACKKFPNLC